MPFANIGSQILIHRFYTFLRYITPDSSTVIMKRGTFPSDNRLEDSVKKQAMLAAIIDSSEDAIISKTLDGIITSWNNAAQQMFGYAESEVIGKHISILIPDDRLEEEDMIIDRIRKGLRVQH